MGNDSGRERFEGDEFEDDEIEWVEEPSEGGASPIESMVGDSMDALAGVDSERVVEPDDEDA